MLLGRKESICIQASETEILASGPIRNNLACIAHPTVGLASIYKANSKSRLRFFVVVWLGAMSSNTKDDDYASPESNLLRQDKKAERSEDKDTIVQISIHFKSHWPKQ
jgi:hypothetical protein